MPVAAAAGRLRVEIARGPQLEIPDDALLAFGYGPFPAHQAGADRRVTMGLSVVDGTPALELWRVTLPVVTGVEGEVRYAAGDGFLSGVIDLDEARFTGVADAAEAAYRRMGEFLARRRERHLLRVWNFLDAINAGEGDCERYRQFCIGRARGIGDLPSERLPAATAVGRPIAAGRLQVCWLAGLEPGTPVENPRQLRAFRYPRRYGPSPPAFARAICLSSGELVGSGTSSIVGHESRHEGDLAAQVFETLQNLRELYRAGGGRGVSTGGQGLPAQTVGHTRSRATGKRRPVLCPAAAPGYG